MRCNCYNRSVRCTAGSYALGK